MNRAGFIELLEDANNELFNGHVALNTNFAFVKQNYTERRRLLGRAGERTIRYYRRSFRVQC